MCRVCAVKGERLAKTLNTMAASCYEIPVTISYRQDVISKTTESPSIPP